MLITEYRKGLFRAIDAICIFIALATINWLMLPEDLSIFTDYTGASFFTVFSYLLFFYILDAYNIGAEDIRETIGRVAVAFICGAIASATAFYTFQQWRFDRLILIVLFALCFIFCIGWRMSYWLCLGRFVHRPRLLLVGTDTEGKVRQVLEEAMTDAEILGYVGVDSGYNHSSLAGACLGTPLEVESVAEKYHATMIVLLPDAPLDDDIATNLLQAKLHGRMIVDVRSFCEHMTHRLPVSQIDSGWLLTESGFSLNTRGSLRRLKRAFDVASSLSLLLLTLPIMLIAAVCIRLESPGPVIYCQKRVGLFGRTFTIFKFRSMRQDAEKNGAVWAAEHDPRITRFGRFIRKTRIDELPQLWNVLNGDMSLIGPRPERPEFVAQLERQIPFYGLRHAVKPGVSGWAQVCYPYGSTVDDARRKLEFDLYYVKNMSLLLDIHIVLKTIGVVLFPKGAR
ncbi:MAG: sugar transferase [Desulfovibrionaceae bacterium]|nr:sugar transferase [Desulfovibrionaceae bacterium]